MASAFKGRGVKFKTPDGAILAYHAATIAAEAPKTPSMGQTGREYAYRCPNRKCRRTKRTTTVGRKGALVERCAFCGSVWDWVDAYVLAGQNHSGKGGGAPPRVERAAALGSVVSALENTEELRPGYADLYIAWLCVGTKSIEAIAEDADRINLVGEHWTKSRVETAIKRSRRWLEHELDRRGLLANAELGGYENAKNA